MAVSGFGGVFLRTDDPKALYAWYVEHLGLIKSEGGAYSFPVPTKHPEIVFSFFKQDNEYFPLAQKAMINLQVDDLDALLDKLIANGVTVDPKREDYAEFGRFGWATDPAGNRIEFGSRLSGTLWFQRVRLSVVLSQVPKCEGPEAPGFDRSDFRSLYNSAYESRGTDRRFFHRCCASYRRAGAACRGGCRLKTRTSHRYNLSFRFRVWCRCA